MALRPHLAMGLPFVGDYLNHNVEPLWDSPIPWLIFLKMSKKTNLPVVTILRHPIRRTKKASSRQRSAIRRGDEIFRISMAAVPFGD